MRGKDIVHGSVKTGGSDNWQTEDKVLDAVCCIGPIGLDPATAPDNPTDAEYFFTEEDDGLSQEWLGHGLVFGNPPYSQNRLWVAKCVEQAKQGAEIVLLIPARTGAQYFAPCWGAQAINFISGRLTFNDSETGLPRPDGKGNPMQAGFNSVLVYWGPRPAKFKRATGHLGKVIML